MLYWPRPRSQRRWWHHKADRTTGQSQTRFSCNSCESVFGSDITSPAGPTNVVWKLSTISTKKITSTMLSTTSQVTLFCLVLNETLYGDHDGGVESENEDDPVPCGLKGTVVQDDVRRGLGCLLFCTGAGCLIPAGEPVWERGREREAADGWSFIWVERKSNDPSRLTGDSPQRKITSCKTSHLVC